jgi:hypothetical protein
MPELLLVEAAADGTNSTPDELSRWAASRHDELDSRGQVTAADRRRLASWLRVQAVGRPTVTITEARVEKYAGMWAAAAHSTGLDIRLISAAGVSHQPTPDRDTSDPTGAAAIEVDDRWRTRSRVWLLDRAEAAGRVAIRAIQR